VTNTVKRCVHWKIGTISYFPESLGKTDTRPGGTTKAPWVG
jgi:hypothetical protein